MGYGLIKEDTLSDIANAIRAKNELDVTYKPSEMAAAIAALSTSAETVTVPSHMSEGVEFVDHDGTLLYSYTWDEALALTSLPSLPSWTAETVGGFSIPMTCTGWNWSLNNIQSCTQGLVRVGATYEPTDDRTHMIIWVGVGGDIMLNLGCSVADSAVIIDWGDGSTTETTSTDETTYTHAYKNEADSYYDVTITANNGTAHFGSISLSSLTAGCMGTVASYDYRWRCGTLRELYVSSAITYFSSYSFRRCQSLTDVTIPKGITTAGQGTFCYCYSLKNVTLPSGFKSADTSSFYYCYGLTNIVFPDSLTTISSISFCYCYGLQSVTIPAGVTRIENQAFLHCYNLKNVTILSGVTSIVQAFYSCYSLASVTIPDSVTHISDSSFLRCYSLTSVVIPEGVTAICESLFNQCGSITNVTIPDSVETIETYAFRYCYSLASVAIPDSVTSIADYAFQYSGIVSLDGLYIGSSDTAACTFQYCYRLTYLTNVREVNATLYLGESPLTYDSAINLLNGLSSENTGTVTLSSTTYALLGEDDLAIATDKGWTVASA